MKHVMYFTAEWCNPCKRIKPIAEELEREGFVNFQIIDADDNPELCKSFEVRGVPTFIVIEDGKEVRRVTGAPPTREDFINFIEGKNGSN
jgi:thiol-disulfide isomerase/thioredoxin